MGEIRLSDLGSHEPTYVMYEAEAPIVYLLGLTDGREVLAYRGPETSLGTVIYLSEVPVDISSMVNLGRLAILSALACGQLHRCLVSADGWGSCEPVNPIDYLHELPKQGQRLPLLVRVPL